MVGVSEDQVAEWQAAVGRQTTEVQRLDAASLTRYARAVGVDDDAMVPLAHWAFFLPCPRDGQIGEDGHPRRGGFLPAITLPRRMFAASTAEILQPLLIGEEAEQTSTISNVTHKSGSTGDLVFVEVERVIAQSGELRLRETQTYVYRDVGSPPPMPQPLASPPQGDAWCPSEVNLFRFSAATFNGHHIHYDAPYARDVEGYPALVVHGPFTAARLASLAMRNRPLKGFSFRARAPLFLGQAIYLRAEAEGVFEAVRGDGAVAMTATATY